MMTFNAARSIYTRQSSQNDCGWACLKMIFRYSGIPVNDSHLALPQNGISLLKLRMLAEEHQLRAKCVEMDLDTLLQLTTPCILHTKQADGNNHFVVYLGKISIGKEQRLLIADPSLSLILMDQQELSVRWQTKAALYFPEIRPRKQPKFAQWRCLVKHLGFSRALWLIVPAISMTVLGSGIGMGWCLQRMFLTDFTDGYSSTINWLALILSIIMARSLAAFLKQQLLVRLYSDTGTTLTKRLFDRLTRSDKNQSCPLQDLKIAFNDIHRIKQAHLALCSVFLPDLLSILAAVGILANFLPGIAFLQLILMTIQLATSFKWSSINNAEMASIGAATKNFEEVAVRMSNLRGQFYSDRFKEDIESLQAEFFLPLNERGMRFARYHNIYALLLDIPSLICVALTFLFSVHDYFDGSITRLEMVFALGSSLFTMTINARLLPVISQIAAGADSCQFLSQSL